MKLAYGPGALSLSPGTRGIVRVVLDGQEVALRGMVSQPFGIYRGTSEGPGERACHRFTLVHLPTSRTITTLRTIRQCKALAAELPPIYATRGEQAGEPVAARHFAEQA